MHIVRHLSIYPLVVLAFYFITFMNNKDSRGVD